MDQLKEKERKGGILCACVFDVMCCVHDDVHSTFPNSTSVSLFFQVCVHTLNVKSDIWRKKLLLLLLLIGSYIRFICS